MRRKMSGVSAASLLPRAALLACWLTVLVRALASCGVRPRTCVHLSRVCFVSGQTQEVDRPRESAGAVALRRADGRGDTAMSARARARARVPQQMRDACARAARAVQRPLS